MIFTMDGVAMPTKNPPKSRVFHTAVLNIYIGAPYKGHTVTLADDHMLIAFGFVYTKEGNVLNDEILIYNIGDYADFDQWHFLRHAATRSRLQRSKTQTFSHAHLFTS
uniref:Uncharacterized protein n=1 Tax=Rhizophagus irregularis (strain DAOM 181602 / DAOM 197198 / MUCL 43194) TaxID=747089 RepID=U9UIW6_RHIID